MKMTRCTTQGHKALEMDTNELGSIKISAIGGDIIAGTDLVDAA